MINVDRSAGQYFVNKQTDIFQGTERELGLLGIEKKEDLLTMHKKEQDFQDTMELILHIMSDGGAKSNKRFDLIRDPGAQTHIISDESMFRVGNEYKYFATGSLSELGERVRLHQIEDIQRCACCGAILNVCHTLRPTGLCVACEFDLDAHMSAPGGANADRFEKLRW